MNQTDLIPISNFPKEDLRLFHGIANWVEESKNNKPKLISWRKGIQQVKNLSCQKPKQKEKLKIPEIIPDNTLFIPVYMGGKDVIKQIRHAFCHAALSYDENSKDYTIKVSPHIKIAGKFTVQAIKEFIGIFLQSIK